MKTIAKAACTILLTLMAFLPLACKRAMPGLTAGSYPLTFTPTSTITLTRTVTITPTETITDTPVDTPTETVTDTPVDTPTVTDTPTPVTISVNVNNGTLGAYSGFYYEATGFTNDPNTGVLTLTARVGDTVQLPGVSGFHPLYFDDGTTTCIYTASGVTETFTFTLPGTYYFHCGFHAQSCTTQAGCGSTDCSAMAGVILVSP